MGKNRHKRIVETTEAPLPEKYEYHSSYSEEELAEFISLLDIGRPVSYGAVYGMYREYAHLVHNSDRKGGGRHRSGRNGVLEKAKRKLEAAKVIMEHLKYEYPLPGVEYIKYEEVQLSKKKLKKIRRNEAERKTRKEKRAANLKKLQEKEKKARSFERKLTDALRRIEQMKKFRKDYSKSLLGKQMNIEIQLQKVLDERKKTEELIQDILRKIRSDDISESDEDDDSTSLSSDSYDFALEAEREEDEYSARVYVYSDIDAADQEASDEEYEGKQLKAVRKLPGGLKERLTLRQYETIPDEYNAVKPFLTYDMDAEDFQYCANAQLIYSRIASFGLTASTFCEKQKTKVYLDWLLAEKESGSPIMSNARIELTNNKMAMLIYKVHLPEEYSLDDQLEENMPVAMSFCDFSNGFQELLAFVEAIDYKKRCFYASVYRHNRTNYVKSADNVKVHKKSNSFVYKGMLRAIDFAASRSVYFPLLFPQPTDSDKFLLEESSMSIETASSFNELQKVAIQEIAFGNPKYSFVLFGPPGTGKTTVIVEAIYQILNANTDSRILICAPSGRAADVIAERILDCNIIHRKYIFRLNSLFTKTTDRNPKLDLICKFANIPSEETMNKLPMFKRNEITNACLRLTTYEIARVAKLNHYRIIVATLAATSYLISGVMKRGHFSHIIIDEAGQATEPETWIPITGLADASTRVVLSGDPKQLGPIVDFKLAEKTGCNRSMLERLCNLSSYKSNKKLMVMLEVSYRCHPEILRISSNEFYGGKLVPHDKCESYHRIAKWALLPKPGFPIIFESVGNGFEDREGNSYFNQIELEHVTNYVRLLLADGIVKEHEIGVISPYRAQTERLRNELKAYEGLTVDSVERFQGSERPVIILTTVRTEALGFLANEKRFNTSITRAQNLLIVIGNSDVLQRNELWNRFYRHCVMRGGFTKWDKDK